jgi:hypothetical protein
LAKGGALRPTFFSVSRISSRREASQAQQGILQARLSGAIW